MTTINQLSQVQSLSAADQLVVWSAANGDSRKASMSVLMDFIQATFADPVYTTVITAPTVSGFNLLMSGYATNVWEILNPTGTFAAGTVTLPPPASCFDGQQVAVCTSQTITTFTLAGNGSTLVGAPTSLGAGGFFVMRFNALQKCWYCVSQTVGPNPAFATVVLTGSINDSNGNELLKVVSTVSAVNELTATNAAAGGAPSLSATGNDTDISINLIPKGAGVLKANGVPVLASNVAAWSAFLTTPSSANLLALLTDETGTGANVFAISPTLVTPILGVASATSVTASSFVKITGCAVAALPLAATAGAGARATVTDANATLTAGIGAIVAPGGANIVPVFSDGTNWRIG